MRVSIVFAAAAAAALLAIVATGLGWLNGTAAGGGAPVPPLAVRTSLERNAVLFGDPVVAEVEVEYDPRVIASGSIRVQPEFTPYVVSSAPELRRLRSGRAGVLRYRYTLLCVTEGCLPTRGPRRLKLRPVKVTGAAGRQTFTSTAGWPPLLIVSRLAPADLSGSVRFRHSSKLPAPRFAVAPRALAEGLVVAAALCALAAFGLIGGEVARRRGRVRRRRLTPLEVAVAFTRESALRTDPRDRRKALELLAEAVGATEERPLARAAADAAWSQEPPTPARTIELADEVGGATMEIE